MKWEQVNSYLIEVGEYTYHNAWIIAVCILLLVLAVAGVPRENWGWINHAPRSYRRRGKNMRNDRMDYVLNSAVMDFADKIEQRVYDGEYTRTEAGELYRRLKRVFPKVKDIFPSPEKLKENIQRRLAKPEDYDCKLPGRTPKKKMRHMFDVSAPPERVVL